MYFNDTGGGACVSVGCLQTHGHLRCSEHLQLFKSMQQNKLFK